MKVNAITEQEIELKGDLLQIVELVKKYFDSSWKKHCQIKVTRNKFVDVRIETFFGGYCEFFLLLEDGSLHNGDELEEVLPFLTEILNLELNLKKRSEEYKEERLFMHYKQ